MAVASVKSNVQKDVVAKPNIEMAAAAVPAANPNMPITKADNPKLEMATAVEPEKNNNNGREEICYKVIALVLGLISLALMIAETVLDYGYTASIVSLVFVVPISLCLFIACFKKSWKECVYYGVLYFNGIFMICTGAVRTGLLLYFAIWYNNRYNENMGEKYKTYLIRFYIAAGLSLLNTIVMCAISYVCWKLQPSVD